MMRFTKMQGIGNDYVYINCFEETVADPAAMAIAVSDRHRGIGSDGLILILPSSIADVRMRMFNADGSESEMCGNGIRCVAKYAFDHGLSKSNPMRIETGRGVLLLALEVVDGKVKQVTVDMGEPIFEPLDQIPVNPETLRQHSRNAIYTVFDAVGNSLGDATFVSMGNPHAVLFVDDVASIDVPRIGPQLENHVAFPRRMNIHWVQVVSRDEVRMRTWERGSGVTQACGTGACAVAVAGALRDKTNSVILAHLPGGDLTLEWKEEDDRVYMTGPATEVFSGIWDG